jgi:small subunit ribosomal protein S19e
MVNVHDVPSAKLLPALAEEMKKLPGMEAPEWSKFAKTGSHAERPPLNQDWWFARAASIMRKLYLHGPLGVGDLERGYGGSKAVAYFPKHHRDAGSSSIRKILKELEQAGLVGKTPKGRVLTPKGTAMLDKLSKDIFTELSKDNKALARYA